MSQTSTPQRLSLLDAINIIVGSMIGSGIFLVTADMARQVQTPGLVLAAWALTGVWIVLGALSYGELGAMFPHAGGLYVYLKEAFGRAVGFLYGWSFFVAIQTGTVAAVAVAFAKYLGIFVPGISTENVLMPLPFGFELTTQNLLAIACLLLLTLVNLQQIKTGAMVQNVFTFTKTGALVVVLGLGLILAFAGQGSWDNLAPNIQFVPKSDSFQDSLFLVFGAAMIGSVFSASAWEYVTFTAGEMINPRRNLPRALVIGTVSVILIYLATNVVYFYYLPVEAVQQVAEDRVGTLLMQSMLGSFGEILMALLILVSTFGCLNGLILSGARVTYAMARDGLFFRQAARLNRHGSPAWVLWAQFIWGAMLCLTGSYSQLLDLTVFVMVLFYLLPAVGLMILRKKQPHAERPVKVWGYPYVPILFIALAMYIGLTTLIAKPHYAGAGLGLVLAGIPIYLVLDRRQRKSKPTL